MNRLLDFLIVSFLSFLDPESTKLMMYLAKLTDEGWTVVYTPHDDRRIDVKLSSGRGSFSYFGSAESVQGAIENWLKNYA